MTLDEMYQECAMYIDETISKTGGLYTGDSLVIVNKLKTAINYIYQKVAKERYKLIYSESITLDSNKQFSISSLTNTFYELVKIEDSNASQVSWKFVPNEKIECPYKSSGDTLTIFYYYIPSELTNLTDEPIFPNGAINDKIYCFYASYFYLSQEIDSFSQAKSGTYFNLFKDGYDTIKQNRGDLNMVVDVYTQPSYNSQSSFEG